MGTFSVPGDDDVDDVANGTPKPRSPLPFARRAFASSLASSSPKRSGTPQTAPSRRFMMSTRDDNPPSTLSNSSIATARNIFRSSTFSDSLPSAAFSPSLPRGAPKKVFAPGATPEPSRTFRQSTAQATPRGMASKTTDKELFSMRISSPPSDLSGEVLTQKVPAEWKSKGSIYADQFLAHLCPPGFDEEQRRQFFCILDLRRLKYAANEIFAGKDWKLNVINFAKEFEKSRSIILLRYGLYEFQNVKPSKEVLKRWRREHGLPEPEDDEVAHTPTKTTSTKKRKASDDISKDSTTSSTSAHKGKRRATEEEETETTPAPSNHKRKASAGEEQPNKIQKAGPSSAKSLFEKIANKTMAAPRASQTPSSAKASSFNGKMSSSSDLARSVLTNTKASNGPTSGPAGSNIIGYLSEASPAKNSGVEDDAESESETGSEAASPIGPNNINVAASGNGETEPAASSGLIAKQPASLTSGTGPGLSSSPGTRESTPGRSLFERVTKNVEGQPVQAVDTGESTTDKPAAPRDQTWNPSTTPIKFASSTSGVAKHHIFGQANTAPASSVFAPKSTTMTNASGVGQESPSSKEPTVISTDEGSKEGCESDKENESQPSKKGCFEPKAPAAQPSLGSSLFQAKPVPAEIHAGSETPTQSSNLFGSLSKPEVTPASTSLLGTGGDASGTTTAAASPAQSFSFGAKPAQSDKAAETEAPKAGSLFGGVSAGTALGGAGASSLFGTNKLASNASTGPGSGASTPAASLFGAPSVQSSGSEVAKTSDAAPPAALAQPMFGFKSSSNAADGTNKSEAAPPKPLFGGGPKSPNASGTEGSLFGGSPMKQDEQSPAKKALGAGSSATAPGAIFGFNKPQAEGSVASSSGIFGGIPAPATGSAGSASTGSGIFGAGAGPGTGSGSFNFNFGGGGASGSSFNNPFAKTSEPTPAATAGGGFSFAGAPSGPVGGSSASFQFGSGSGAQGSAAATPKVTFFGAAQPDSKATASFGGTSTPMFGGASTSSSFGASASGAAPVFSFASTPSQPSQGNLFGSSQAVPAVGGLQPPAGGSSTTGTNSPLNLGGGGSSLATTPAAGTPEPSNSAEGAAGGENEEGDKLEQINLTDGVDAKEAIVHEVRAKALKFVPVADGDGQGKSKSPWSTQGVGPLRLLKHKETGMVRLVLRAEPRGNVALNRAVLANMAYKADEKYVKIMTSNEGGDGLETWMVQVKTKDLAKGLAEALEKNKGSNEQ